MNIFLIFSITSFFPSLPCMQRDALIRGVRPVCMLLPVFVYGISPRIYHNFLKFEKAPVCVVHAHTKSQFALQHHKSHILLHFYIHSLISGIIASPQNYPGMIKISRNWGNFLHSGNMCQVAILLYSGTSL